MLLVYDDDAQVVHRGEQSAARAYYHVEIAAADVPPLVELLARRLLAVEQGHPPSEPGVDPLQRLRSQRDLRHQEHSPASQPHRVGNGPQVHLGLATPGDAVKQEGAIGQKRALSLWERLFGSAQDMVGVGAFPEGYVQGGGDFRQSPPLLGGEGKLLRPVGTAQVRDGGRAAGGAPPLLGHQSLPPKGLHDTRAELAVGLAYGQVAGRLAHGFQQGLLARGEVGEPFDKLRINV